MHAVNLSLINQAYIVTLKEKPVALKEKPVANLLHVPTVQKSSKVSLAGLFIWIIIFVGETVTAITSKVMIVILSMKASAVPSHHRVLNLVHR